jgi:hypothetical protein
MTRDDFPEAPGWDLLWGGVSFDPVELREFARDVWPVAGANPDPGK